MLASVISNASDLLRLDLDGIHVLLPQILAALEDLQPRFRYRNRIQLIGICSANYSVEVATIQLLKE